MRALTPSRPSAQSCRPSQAYRAFSLQVTDRTWLALDRASQTPASSPPPTGAPRCQARGAPPPAAVALDEVRTTTCKDSTRTDASRPAPCGRRGG